MASGQYLESGHDWRRNESRGVATNRAGLTITVWARDVLRDILKASEARRAKGRTAPVESMSNYMGVWFQACRWCGVIDSNGS